jgi:hypothetical protein
MIMVIVMVMVQMMTITMAVVELVLETLVIRLWLCGYSTLASRTVV